MIEHWGGQRLLHLKSVVREYLRVIFIPKSHFRHSSIFFVNPQAAGRIPKPFLRSVPSALCYVLVFLFLALGSVPLPVADAAQVTLGWDSNSEPDLEGYVIYRNAGSPGPPYDYTNTLPEDDLADPLHPMVTLTGLKKGEEYYIALTAYNSEGVESSFSNDVCVEVLAGGSASVCANSSNSESSNNNNSSNGGDGGFGRWDVAGCFISTAGNDSSTFSEFVAKPVIRSQVLALVFLLLVLIAAAKFVFNKTKEK
jgi:hypothetical protein